MEAVDFLGGRELRAIAAITAQALARPVAAARTLSGQDGSSAAGLGELRRLAAQLTASASDFDARPRRRLFGILPATDPAELFLARGERAQQRIEEVLGELREAQQALRSDNAAIDEEQRALESQLTELRRDSEIVKRIDQEFAASPAAAPTDVLVAVKQRHRDLVTQVAVGVQAAAALHIVAENNREIIRAIETATTTTAVALQTSAVVRQALLTQRLVRGRLDEAQRAIAGVARGAQVETLKAAWAGVHASLEQVDQVRGRAVDAASASARALSPTVEEPPTPT